MTALIVVAFLLGSLGSIIAGITLALRPKQFRDWIDRLSGISSLPLSSQGFLVGPESRIAGVILAVAGGAFFGLCGYWALTSTSWKLATPSIPPSGSPGGGWDSFLLILVVAVFGAILLVKPTAINNWVRRILKHREVTGFQTRPSTYLVVRLVGVGLLAWAIYEWLALSRVGHP